MYICRCNNLPPEGNFIKGKEYEWDYIIDATYIIDDNGEQVVFDDIKFYWYFTKITGK